MKINTLSAILSTSPQITAADIEIIAKQGFCSIICNRPDNEAPNQPSFAEIAQAAKAAGLEIQHIPVIPGKITDEDVTKFGAAIGQLPKPILAFCGSGMRSSGLWSRSQAKQNN